MAIGQLFFAYAARHTDLRPLANPYLHGAVGLSALAQVALGVGLPGALEAVPLPLGVWLLVFGMALLAFALAEAVDRAVWKRGRPTRPPGRGKAYPSMTTGRIMGSRPVAFFRNFFTG